MNILKFQIIFLFGRELRDLSFVSAFEGLGFHKCEHHLKTEMLGLTFNLFH